MRTRRLGIGPNAAVVVSQLCFVLDELTVQLDDVRILDGT